jgi:GNAT superfamily N-acetyltransferase
MIVQTATPEDVPAWLGLAAEVEELFGAPMAQDAGLRAALVRNLDRGSAFCVRVADGPPGVQLIGALLWRGHHPPAYQITWMSLAATHRRQGVGGALVEHVRRLVPEDRQSRSSPAALATPAATFELGKAPFRRVKPSELAPPARRHNLRREPFFPPLPA